MVQIASYPPEIGISEARHRALIEAAEAMVSENDLTGRCTYLSGNVRRITGFDPEAFKSLRPLERVHRDDRSRVVGWLADLRAGQHAPPFRYRYQVRSGAWHVFEAAASTYRFGDGAIRFVFATRDVTQAVSAGTALRASEARHHALAEGRRGFVQELGGNRRRVYVSESITECLGYRPQEWLAMETPEPLHPDDLGRVRSLKATIAAWEAGETIDARLRHRSGEYRWFEVRAMNRYRAADGETHYVLRLQDVTAERERAARLAQLETERDGLLRELLASEDTERRRVAHDLHDGPAQQLAAATMLLQACDDSLAERLSEADRALLTKARAQVDLVGREVRRIMLGLRPPELDDLGLVGALRALAESTAAAAGLSCRVQLQRADRAIGEGVQMILYRVAQEALSNVVKHAEATELSLRFQQTADSVTLIVEDDGLGFDPTAKRYAPGDVARLGLTGMRERARLVGGTLRIDGQPGQGTIVRLSAPLDRA